MTERDSSDELIGILSAELLRARQKLSQMVITELAPDDTSAPQKILLDFKEESPTQILADYATYMDTFDTLPIDPAGEKLRLYRGEWTIWSGFPGTGKTTLLRQMACHFLKQGHTVFAAILEQDPRWFIVEMAATAAGVEMPSVEQLTCFLETYGDKLKVWGFIGIAEHSKIFAMIRHLADKHGCTHAIIDSLMALDVDSTDNEAQRQFANLVSATARSKGVHIHMVAHPRKPMGPDQAPNVWDVAGSSDLGRLAFNVLFIRRGPPSPGNDAISQMVVHVLKQRTMGPTGEIPGFFYRRHRQFHVDGYANDPIRYLPDSQYAPTGVTDDVPFHESNPSAFRVEREPPTSNPWDVP
jgi:hypothetical protein